MSSCGLITKFKIVDYVKLAQRTIALLSSMIENGEYHTTRTKEMKDNAINGLEELRIQGVLGQRFQLMRDTFIKSREETARAREASAIKQTLEIYCAHDELPTVNEVLERIGRKH